MKVIFDYSSWTDNQGPARDYWYTGIVRFDNENDWHRIQMDHFSGLFTVDHSLNGVDTDGYTSYMAIITSKYINKEWDIFSNNGSPILRMNLSHKEVTVSGKKMCDYSVSFEPYVTKED